MCKLAISNWMTSRLLGAVGLAVVLFFAFSSAKARAAWIKASNVISQAAWGTNRLGRLAAQERNVATEIPQLVLGQRQYGYAVGDELRVAQ